jgi:hypothetical protein
MAMPFTKNWSLTFVTFFLVWPLLSVSMAVVVTRHS